MDEKAEEKFKANKSIKRSIPEKDSVEPGRGWRPPEERKIRLQRLARSQTSGHLH